MKTSVRIIFTFSLLSLAACSTREDNLRNREPLPLLRAEAWKLENPQCEVKGNAANWQAAYCMWMNRTNDSEADEVQNCYNSLTSREGIPRSLCERNQFFKREICKTLVVDRTFTGSVSDCLRSDDSVPRVVREGLDPVS